VLGRGQVNRAGEVENLNSRRNGVWRDAGELEALRPGYSENIAIAARREEEAVLMMLSQRPARIVGQPGGLRGNGRR